MLGVNLSISDAWTQVASSFTGLGKTLHGALGGECIDAFISANKDTLLFKGAQLAGGVTAGTLLAKGINSLLNRQITPKTLAQLGGGIALLGAVAYTEDFATTFTGIGVGLAGYTAVQFAENKASQLVTKQQVQNKAKRA